MTRLATLGLPWILVVLVSPAALPGPNQIAVLPLHAVDTPFGSCDISDPCASGPANTQVPLRGTLFSVYLLARHYGDLTAVQTAFEWPDEWVFVIGLWDCLPNQVSQATPYGPGPGQGELATAFDCISGGETVVIGRMTMIANVDGCVEQIASSLPQGSHFASCKGEIDAIESSVQTGSVCTDFPGRDVCEGVPSVRAVCCRYRGGCDGLWWQCDDGYVLMQQPCQYCVWQGACCHADRCEYMDDDSCWFEGGDFYAGQTCDEVDCVNPALPTTWGRIKVLHRE